MDFTDGPLARTANLHRLHAQVVGVPGRWRYPAGPGARGAGWLPGTPIPSGNPGRRRGAEAGSQRRGLGLSRRHGKKKDEVTAKRSCRM